MGYQPNRINYLAAHLAAWEATEWRNGNILKSKRIQKVIDRINLRKQKFIKKHGQTYYNCAGGQSGQQ
jgi:hypothetical protein